MTDRAAGGAGGIRLRLLGPVEVEAGGERRRVRGTRRVAVLAALALRPGEVISAGQLADAVWSDGTQPRAAGATLRSHVSYLRGVLGDRDAIAGRQPGYLLNLVGEITDAQAAERLITDGARSPDPAHAAAQLQAAVAMWRGGPLAELAGLAWFDVHVHRLEQLLLQAQELLAGARLVMGQHAQLIGELESLTRQHPFHEQFWGQLMVALYRTGRQGDALAAYQRARQLLRDELGVDPGRPLRELHAAVLRHDAELAVPRPGPARTASAGRPAPVAVPAQLPLAVTSFTGREAELRELDQLVPDVVPRPHAPVPPTLACVLSGTAGVGKTALAVHWGHRAAPRFPGGQLYVNLRGFDPGGPALAPADVLHGFLQALDVPPDRIPAGLPERAALYRSLLAGRRVLVVLDNARDAQHVRPLLPGTAGSLAIVTSRDELTALVAAEGAQPLPLGLLTTAEARELLARRVGPGRVAAEPVAVADIITRCARLPLALAIAGARAATHPGFSLGALAAELRDTDTRLAALHGGDPATDLRAVFSWSYQALSDPAADLFVLLGLHPGPDISTSAAASLAACPRPAARLLLTELTRAGLLTEHTPGRYLLHDLLHVYATEQAHHRVRQPGRHDALGRLLDHYLHTANTAAQLLKPWRDPIDLAGPQPGTVAEVLSTFDDASTWFTAEYRVLLACTGAAAAAGLDRHAWQLAWAAKTYLFRRGHWDDVVTTHRIAAGAARRGGDLAGLGSILFSLAEAYVRLNRLDEAESAYQQVLEAYTAASDLSGEADAYLGLAELAEQQDRVPDALGYARQALSTFRRAGDLGGQGLALNTVGWFHAQQGEYEQALAPCQEALVLLQSLGFADGEAGAWHSLGHAHCGLADYQQATLSFQRAHDLFRELGDRYNQAVTLHSLGDAHHLAGELAAAQEAWRQALLILEELSDPGAGQVRAKLGLVTAHHLAVTAAQAVSGDW